MNNPMYDGTNGTNNIKPWVRALSQGLTWPVTLQFVISKAWGTENLMKQFNAYQLSRDWLSWLD